MGERVAITGATGQLGAALALRLRDEGHDVHALVRDPTRLGALPDDHGLTLHSGDVTDPASLARWAAGSSAVFHLAGVVSYWPRNRGWVMRVNVEGTRAVLAAAKGAGAETLVHTSSIAALGSVPAPPDSGVEGDEETPFDWGPLRIAYCDSKHASERLALGASGIRAVAVNPGIVLGAGDVHMNGARMLAQVRDGALPGVPPGATTLSNLPDVVEGQLLAWQRGEHGQRYVLGSGTGTFREVFGWVGEVLGKPAPTRVLPRRLMALVAAGHELMGALRGVEPKITRQLVAIAARNRRYRSAKASAALGYAPADPRRGIEDCWRWMRDSGRS